MTLNIVSSFNGVSDPDAAAYIEAVEAADGELLEFAVGKAINDFVLGCKADGIWGAIKASCILAGARTLSGALVPLTGLSPSASNFVSGDYDRKAGLVGNGVNKYINSSRANNADPQNSNHNALWVSAYNGNNFSLMGAAEPFNESGANSLGITGTPQIFSRSRTGNAYLVAPGAGVPGLIGTSRSSSANYVLRYAGNSATVNEASQAPTTRNVIIYDRTIGGTTSPSRIAFYSIGESLDLALLDARVTDLITAFGAAIP